jgi:hypothetical protein
MPERLAEEYNLRISWKMRFVIALLYALGSWAGLRIGHTDPHEPILSGVCSPEG